MPHEIFSWLELIEEELGPRSQTLFTETMLTNNAWIYMNVETHVIKSREKQLLIR